MNRVKQGLILLVMALGVMGIAISSTYTKTYYYMKDINHIKESAYKR